MDIVLKLVFVLSLLVVSIEPLESTSRKRGVDAEDPKERNPGAVEHLVTGLPDQPNVTFRQYAGHITVDEKKGRALFYWFYEATTLPDNKPLVLWLNGGPGCSSVGYGATQEIGPFLLGTNGLTLNSFSWTTEANILFLESPIGVGFSYTNTSGDYDSLGDDFTANDAYVFISKWFLKFPTYLTREFFIAGESYAGKYIPELAEVIVDKNKQVSSSINLKGILLGNPETDYGEDWKGLVDYAWSHAVISDELHKIIMQSCNFSSYNDSWSNSCSDAVIEMQKQYNEIDIYSLYTPVCTENLPAGSGNKSTLITAQGSNMIPRVMGDNYDPCLDNYAKSYYNRPDVQKALHVSDGTILKNWSICNMEIFYSWSDSKPSVIPIYKKLISAETRIWLYSGDTDGRVPVLSTRYSLILLGLSVKKKWGPWYHKNQVGGWFQEYDGLTFSTFRGAGHAVPIFKPSESLALFASFLAGESLPSRRK